MIHILNIEPGDYSPKARRILEEIGGVTEKEVCRDELPEIIEPFDVLIVRLAHQIDREIITRGKRLKAIVTATTGLDHIDLEAARELGIEVLSLNGEREFLATVVATPEHTFALLLSLLRRIPQAARSVLMGEWNRDLFKGHELAGKRLGLLGFGRVGYRVAQYALAFGMNVMAVDPYADRWLEGVERCENEEDMLPKTDILSIHLPLNVQTSKFLGEKEFALLPHSAYLVNTSRGALIDEQAMVKALETGKLAGAALDVMIGERDAGLRATGLLMSYVSTHDNVLVTPHIAGATYESMEKTEIFMAEKLVKFMKKNR